MKISKKVLMTIFLLCILLLLPFATAEGSYELPTAKESIKILDDGTTVINDEITYSIKDSVNGVTRIIPLNGNQSIEDVSVETPGYFNTLEVENTNGGKTMKVWLYKDEAKTQKVSNQDVIVKYSYKLKKGVKIYNDIAEFQYNVWGSGWNKEVGQLTTTVEIPGSHNDTTVWNNPDSYVTDSSWTSDNVLSINYKNIPANTGVEERILIPKSYFKSSQNANVINKDAKSKIISDQEEYAKQQSLKNLTGQLPIIVSIILIIAPLFMYLRWSKEPKILYKADYESQIPTDDSPIFVNAMIPGILEQIDTNAFTATLLYLIDKKYCKLITANEKDTILKISNNDTGNLKQYEVDILDFLGGYEDKKGHIALSKLQEDKYTLSKFFNAWKIDAYKEVPKSKVRKYYDSSKENIMSGYNILALFLGVVFIAYLLVFVKVNILIGLLLSVILILEQIVIFLFVDKPLGHWSPEGKEFHDKWKNFEKYIKDFSLIKERPPESIQVWGQFLVYATALGCAEQVSKNMKKYIKHYNIPDQTILEDDILSLTYFWGFGHIYYTFNHLNPHNTDFGSTGIDTGSFGDIGGPGSGGFGGGGGGVF